MTKTKKVSRHSSRYVSRNKTKKQSNKQSNKQSKKHQKTIRIITVPYDDYKNDISVYLDIFKKMGFDIDFHTINHDDRININYETNTYYDINLFIDTIIPKSNNTSNKYDSFKTIFPAGVHMFAPNMNSFTQYKHLHYIDIVLCNTRICHNFINFIKRENNYKFQSYYTNFTTILPKQLLSFKVYNRNFDKNTKNTFTFIHLAENQTNKNTASIIHCWLKYNDKFIDTLHSNNNTVLPELHITCNGLCFTSLLLDIKKMYNYDLLNKYKFEKQDNKTNENLNILKYNNLYLYLDVLPKDKIYQSLIQNANVVICPSKKEAYPHCINIARYFNKFIITMNSQPMNEFCNDGKNGKNGKNSNCYLLKNTNNYKKRQYKETKYIFTKMLPNIEELRDAILWSIKKGSESGNINVSGNSSSSRIQFDNDKKYFENTMKSIMSKVKYDMNMNMDMVMDNDRNEDINKINTINTIIKRPLYKIFPEAEEDNHCKYINVRGILNSCDIHSLTPVSTVGDLLGYDIDVKTMNSMKNSKDVLTIYVCNTAIPKFAEKLNMNLIKCKFILVSGDSDDTCPDDLFEDETEFKKFIENDNIIHWYSQNCTLKSHPKLTPIPIGLAYHHVYNEDIPEEAVKIISPIKQEAFMEKTNKHIPFWKREIKCYINFNFEKNYAHSKFGYDRYEAITEIPKNLTFSEKGVVNRDTTWMNQSKYAFVVSPLGNGLDCHRTWEALVLGCIPIVKTSGIDNLYDDLPVLIVEDWIDVTEELLMKVVKDFKIKHEKGLYNYDKINLKYWVDKIKKGL